MELSILLLEDALRQQKEQLNDTEKRNSDANSPAFEFRKKAIVNLKRFIADLEKGIEALTLLSKQNEALILPVVVVNEANWCENCNKPVRMINNTLQLLCECEYSEVELCQCKQPKMCSVDEVNRNRCKNCKKPLWHN